MYRLLVASMLLPSDRHERQPRAEQDASHARRLVAQKKLAGGLLLPQLGLELPSQDFGECRSEASKCEHQVLIPKAQSFGSYIATVGTVGDRGKQERCSGHAQHRQSTSSTSCRNHFSTRQGQGQIQDVSRRFRRARSKSHDQTHWTKTLPLTALKTTVQKSSSLNPHPESLRFAVLRSMTNRAQSASCP